MCELCRDLHCNQLVPWYNTITVEQHRIRLVTTFIDVQSTYRTILFIQSPSFQSVEAKCWVWKTDLMPLSLSMCLILMELPNSAFFSFNFNPYLVQFQTYMPEPLLDVAPTAPTTSTLLLLLCTAKD